MPLCHLNKSSDICGEATGKSKTVAQCSRTSTIARAVQITLSSARVEEELTSRKWDKGYCRAARSECTVVKSWCKVFAVVRSLTQQLAQLSNAFIEETLANCACDSVAEPQRYANAVT